MFRAQSASTGILATHPQAVPAGGIPADTTELIVALSFNGRWLALRDTTIDVTKTTW